ncbi:hypothetical protein DBR11_16965 [Pedobacter sp. HMWF019]|uniref:reverse transcriptase domain-containing protein n=1 Tax=Pedobacter sp. HMWF019 TaxID=2056856 RepID=UPI000D3D7E0C|nr:reverse transcriptase domain-containing protein [Pedobacter sp. HMWF019]PTS97523.1 hypothetical protein DBR11_16965 [Pedobacter sp. HMWF019]
MKRNPENVLNSLSKHGSNSAYKFERLYRNLFNEEMFHIAYQNIYAKPGNMTEGVDERTVDGMSLSRIERIIGTLKKETYQPAPSRRTYIPKKNGKKRPLGISSFDDKLVQEVIRMILEAMYEKQFSYTSHGFRPNRSCHTALLQCQQTFGGAKWFIEGDIKGFFDHISHDILIGILRERISDERFIRLVRKFLNAGYVEDWKFFGTYSGTPQGGIISPILANIYLDKLDKYMEEYIRRFDSKPIRQVSTEHKRLWKEKHRLTKRLNEVEDGIESMVLIERIKAIEQRRLNVPAANEMDADYRRLKYVRYADDFLIGVIGSKEDSKRIKEDIKMFLEEKLELQLSDEKTLITHTEQSAKFLGYEVYVRKTNSAKRDKAGRLLRCFNKKVVLWLPMTIIKSKLIAYDVVKFLPFNGREKWKPLHRSILINSDDLEILSKYNWEIRGMYNYYSLANNSSEMQTFKYIMEYSMYKTFARKYRTTVGKILSKYKQGKNFTVRYTTKKGNRASILYNEGFKRKTNITAANADIIANTMLYSKGTTSLIDRLKAEKCERCGSTENLEMHHVRKLKDLKGKDLAEQMMIARQRKTIAVCLKCHTKIHHGG